MVENAVGAVMQAHAAQCAEPEPVVVEDMPVEVQCDAAMEDATNEDVPVVEEVVEAAVDTTPAQEVLEAALEDTIVEEAALEETIAEDAALEDTIVQEAALEKTIVEDIIVEEAVPTVQEEAAVAETIVQQETDAPRAVNEEQAGDQEDEACPDAAPLENATCEDAPAHVQAIDAAKELLDAACAMHFGDEHEPSDLQAALQAAKDILAAARGYQQAAESLNLELQEENKRLKLELMATNALLKAADLDDAAGSDYKPSPQPASECWATDEEVPSEAVTPHSGSRIAIIRRGRPLGASPASVAPRGSAPAATPHSARAPASVTRSSGKALAGTTPAPPAGMEPLQSAVKPGAIRPTPVAAKQASFQNADLDDAGMVNNTCRMRLRPRTKAHVVPECMLGVGVVSAAARGGRHERRRRAPPARPSFSCAADVDAEAALAAESIVNISSRAASPSRDDSSSLMDFADFVIQQGPHVFYAETDLEAEDPVDTSPCIICNSIDAGEVVMLCDGCDASVHPRCAGLAVVPEGDWFCTSCKPAPKAAKAAPKRYGGPIAALFGEYMRAPCAGAKPRPSLPRRPSGGARRLARTKTATQWRVASKPARGRVGGAARQWSRPRRPRSTRRPSQLEGAEQASAARSQSRRLPPRPSGPAPPPRRQRRRRWAMRPTRGVVAGRAQPPLCSPCAAARGHGAERPPRPSHAAGRGA